MGFEAGDAVGADAGAMRGVGRDVQAFAGAHGDGPAAGRQVKLDAALDDVEDFGVRMVVDGVDRARAIGPLLGLESLSPELLEYLRVDRIHVWKGS